MIPRWERNSYWPVITTDGIHLQPEFQSFIEFLPEIVTGPEVAGSAFLHGATDKEKSMFITLYGDAPAR